METKDRQRILFDFSNSATLRSWFVLDDGVMGGISRGRLQLTAHGTAKFTGIVRLDYNGGFSSIKSQFEPIDISRYSGIELRVRGDGKRYGFFLQDRLTHLVYQSDFSTTAGEWQDIRIPFADLCPNWYAMPIRADPINLHHVLAISLIIADKQAGHFMLEIMRMSLLA